MAMIHVTHDDILQTAHLSQVLEHLEQIKYAMLENSSGISIIPMEPDMERLHDRRIEAALQRMKPDVDRPG